MFFDNFFLKLSGLFILAITTARSFGRIIVDTPDGGSVRFLHFVYDIGGHGQNNFLRCNDEACEELTTYYNEFDSEQCEFNTFPDPFNLKSLLLENFGFVTVPNSIFKMSNLTQIIIEKSKIQIVNFNDFITMPRLKEIKLINSAIAAIETEEKDNGNSTSTVEEIDVSFNLIKVVPDNFVKHFINLEKLNMSHNMIDHIDRYAFEGTVKLKTLDLSFNKLKSIENLISLIPKSAHLNAKTPLKELSRLILDANLLVNVNFTAFFDTVTQELSIGDNDIPCSDLEAIKYSAMGEKFNRIVTSQKLCSQEEGVNGISCRKNERRDVRAALDYPSSNTIILIASLKKELERISKRVEKIVEGNSIQISYIDRQLHEIKQGLAKSEK